jgi:hypothetical protein
MAFIFLSVPILDKPEFKMVYSMYQAILSCREHKVRLFVNENDSLISRVRNVHMSLFLEEYKQCDYFISIDSDLEILNCYHTNNLFTKLISHDKEFVGGLYALKQNISAAKASSIPLDPAVDRAGIPFDKGLIPMRWLSAGCWCLKRSAIEKMANAYPALDYVGDDNVTGKPIHGLYNPDIFEIEDVASKQKFKKYLSEDWAFCERWRKIGGEIYADTSVVLRHIGKFPYTLWNVEVVARKVDEPPTEQPKPVVPEKPLIIPKGPQNIPPPPSFNKPSLPPPGWDLQNVK